VAMTFNIQKTNVTFATLLNVSFTDLPFPCKSNGPPTHWRIGSL
jgi:hypothetical protein